MSSDVDICNLALGHIGSAAEVTAIDPADASVEAMHCARFYPAARRVLLESHAWRFATRRAALALLSTTETPDAWGFTYTYPSECLRLLRVLTPSSSNDDTSDAFKAEVLADGSPVIHTNAEEAVAVFTADVTDTTLFTPLFTQALARLLASYLAGPMLKGTSGMKVAEAQYKIYLAEFAQAAARDAGARNGGAYASHTPSSIGVRG